MGFVSIRATSSWRQYPESSIGKLRDELLNGEIFDTLLEAQVLVERWRKHYNGVRSHSALGYRPPAPEAVMPPPLALTPGYSEDWTQLAQILTQEVVAQTGAGHARNGALCRPGASPRAARPSGR